MKKKMKTSWVKAIAASAVAILVMAATMQAATYYVPDDYGAIQDALNAAAAGETIIVRDGIYVGAGNRDLDFGGRAVTLRSENGAETCIIDCEGSARGFYFHSGEGVSSVVDGFTIRNGNAYYGGGIYCYSASPTIKNNTISENTATFMGGGICCYPYSSPTITNNIIYGNRVRFASGAGIYCDMYSSPTIKNNTISKNSAYYYGGAIACRRYSQPKIVKNTICGNSAAWGGGIHCQLYSSAMITNNVICGNYAATGGGVGSDYWSAPTIRNNTMSGNWAQYGGGVFGWGSSPTITNCIIWSNGDELDYCSATYSDIGELDPGVGNINLDPKFVGGPFGAWTSDATYDQKNFQSTLSDATASWTVNALAGSLINPDKAQTFQFPIVRNTVTTITVWGDITSIAGSGKQYEVFDYHLRSQSPCIDAGDPSFIPAAGETDKDGNPRSTGDYVDMGAYEWQPQLSLEDAIRRGIEDLCEAVQNLPGLNKGERKSLCKRLEHALERFERALKEGEKKPSKWLEKAQKDLRKFIERIERLVDKGDITPETGDLLITQTNVIIDLIDQLKPSMPDNDADHDDHDDDDGGDNDHEDD